ncbi:hypothetical protein SEA_PAPAYASALAD_50 [Streptomyces phage PapayaSalad]|uniref:Uncharacterized protein n=1 Tax=Streptomyces phage PapayaSalad TaxID=1920310 RepID=A0A1J0MCA7_9CAUD|nr:hypothetical protein HOR44_gp31 [Streptomyces phage PapayaSalad]APD18629.1 hypothetical protein SEA_PAPAYASALAD_50 [Streptomyces phage PapayaSalad]
MDVTIPGALADHLAHEVLDPTLANAMDAGRRGRGRTLIINATSTRVLHTISRHAEALLATPTIYSRAQRDAARLWIKRVGHAPALLTHQFPSTEEAYDATQCREDINDGDVLVIESEKVVGFLRRSWPAAVTAENGELHRIQGDPRTIDDGRYAASVSRAERIAAELGVPLDHTIAEEAPAADNAPVLYAPRGMRNLTTGHLLNPVTGRATCGVDLAGPNTDAVLTCTACRHHTDGTPTEAPRDEPSNWWTITDPASGEEAARVYGETYQDMTPRAEALPEVRAVIRKHRGFSRRRLLMSELTPAQLDEQRAQEQPPTPEPTPAVEPENPQHAAFRARAAQRLRDALAGSPAAFELDDAAPAGELAEWERDLLAAASPEAPQRFTTADENAAAEDVVDIEARHAAELVTEAEATAGTWRGQWIGEHPDAMFPARPDREQGSLFA